jgi:hypothetical protein
MVDPHVLALYTLVQAEYYKIGMVDDIVSILNIDFLRDELHKHGYTWKVEDDNRTVTLLALPPKEQTPQ